MLSGIVMCGLAVIGLSTMTSLWQFYSFYLLMALGFMCGGPLPNQVLTSRWFHKSKGKAMGIAYLGIGVCGMLVPLIARSLNMRMDWRSSLMILGIFMIAVAFPMAWFVQETPGNRVSENKMDEPVIPFKNILKRQNYLA
ncbi:MAG: MFS transporter [Ginsengibacter sp.]